MQNRLIVPLFLAAASLSFFARGTFAHDDKKPLATNSQNPDTIEVLATTFDVTRPSGDTESVKFALRVVNNTKKMVEIHFPDGQTHDFIVKDSTDKEIWRWSEGRMFTQAMRSKTLKGKDETVFEESWETKGHHGSFTAIAILRSENFPVETSVQFALP
jgi:hypothetical protein